LADTDGRLPLSLAWITPELLDETRRVWSPTYGRVISDQECVTILNNVKRLAHVLMKIKRRNGNQ
jgi:hypothetical protein